MDATSSDNDKLMDDEQIDSLVAKFVEELGINHGNYNDLKPLLKEQLCQIESCFQEAVITRSNPLFSLLLY